MTTSIVEKELFAIASYIRVNYYDMLEETKSLNHNTIVEHGIILMIHKYCKPLVLVSINARELSKCTIVSDDEYNEYLSNKNSKVKPSAAPVKITVVGTRTAGKTCLITRYLENKFPTGYISCLYEGNPCTMTVKVDDKIELRLGIWDTTSKEDCIVPDGNYKGRVRAYPYTDVFMICMSVYDNGVSDTRINMDKSGMWTDLTVHTMAFCQEIQALCPHAVRILVGTKIDLRDVDKYKNDCYTKERMKLFANIWNCHGYFECSALSNDAVKDTFEDVTKTVLEFRMKHLDSKTSTIEHCVVL